jgi:hypothetical protein
MAAFNASVLDNAVIAAIDLLYRVILRFNYLIKGRMIKASKNTQGDPRLCSKMLSRCIEFLSGHFIGIVGIVMVLIYMLTYLENCFGPPIRADGLGYYAYLPAVFIEKDVSFGTLSENIFGDKIGAYTGIRLVPTTNRYLNKFNMGVAVMMLPFFLIAHFVTWCMQSPPGGFDWWKFNHLMDGFSLFYQHAAGLSGVVYMLLGLALLKRVLERFFRRGVVIAGLAALVFGTNLLHYGSGESVLSHPYSFFLFAALLYLIPYWYEAPDQRRSTILLGLLSGLIVLVRVPSMLFLVFVPLYGVTSLDSARQRLRVLLFRWKDCLWMLVLMSAVYFPQMLLHRYATGSWWVNPYARQGEGFNFLSPKILEVLIGPKAGLFFWSPILLLVVPGLFLLKRHASGICCPAIIYLLMNTYIISSWHMWWFGGGFGHRAFIESYTIMAFGLCAVYASVSSRIGRYALLFMSTAFVGYSLFMMKLYYTREISYYGLDWAALFDIFWLRKEMIVEALGLRY